MRMWLHLSKFQCISEMIALFMFLGENKGSSKGIRFMMSYNVFLRHATLWNQKALLVFSGGNCSSACLLFKLNFVWLRIPMFTIYELFTIGLCNERCVRSHTYTISINSQKFSKHNTHAANKTNWYLRNITPIKLIFTLSIFDV